MPGVRLTRLTLVPSKSAMLMELVVTVTLRPISRRANAMVVVPESMNTDMPSSMSGSASSATRAFPFTLTLPRSVTGRSTSSRGNTAPP